MPNMSGTEATRALRAHGYSGVVVGMTGDPTGCPERCEFEAAGLNSCVDKDSKGVAHLERLLTSYATVDRSVDVQHPSRAARKSSFT